MSQNDSTSRRRLSRRRVLQRGTLLASLGTVGLPAISGTAVATNDCPRSPRYWATHWNEYLGESVTISPAGTLTKAEIRSILHARPAGDAVTIVAKQYVATYLNLLQRATRDPGCAHKEVAVEGIGTADWEEVKNAAQHWLRLNGWDGSPYSGYRTWSPSVPVGNTDGTADGEALKDALAAFNDAAFDRLDCDCEDEEREHVRERDPIEGRADDGVDASWHPPSPPIYDRSNEFSNGPGRTPVVRGAMRRFLDWLR